MWRSSAELGGWASAGFRGEVVSGCWLTEAPEQLPLRHVNSRILDHSVTIPEVPDAVSAKTWLGGVAPGKSLFKTFYIADSRPKNAQPNFPMPDWRVIGGQDPQLSEWHSD